MTSFTSHGLRGGLWRGRLRAQDEPGRVILVHAGEVAAEARLTADGAGAWLVEVDLPGHVLSEGVHTLLLKTDPATAGDAANAAGEVLARLPLVAGSPLDEDLLAELASLRAELELCKRELRRFAAETRARG
ncbi:hypothetical protein Q4511_03575 [Paracoccus sp. 1_MG-2023]|uniref:hypothetical protein n=1 Tax=unclassified Paracoccus (in: a-proteobacteria) TaxID=2688777 RepID=UPI001C0A1081|nr:MULTISPECIES: hypothetical protein [unclassified Paracoccus (in: a-proteobacteria)]MBU2956316.1 hypothetical protein [Paracoccus sp. C2R09]MDO6667992.1 hypothetical protein [Paracoccus sp. 1_MG-2023]